MRKTGPVAHRSGQLGVGNPLTTPNSHLRIGNPLTTPNSPFTAGNPLTSLSQGHEQFSCIWEKGT